METSVKRCANQADASFLDLRNVSNALGTQHHFRCPRTGSGVTPQVLGTLSTTFWIFDFRTFYIGFPSNLLRKFLSGSQAAYSSLVDSQTAQYTPPPSFLQKYAFWRFPIFQNQENSRKTLRKGPYTLLWSLEGPSTTLVDMQTAQDTLVSAFFVTDVRHAFVLRISPHFA